MGDSEKENIVELDDQSINTAYEGKVIVDFWAPWCGPCKMQTPVLEELAENHEADVTIAKVNVDEAPQAAADFGVQAIPTLVILEDGNEKNRYTGVQSRETLEGEI